MASIAFRHLPPNSERINPINMPDPIRKCFGYNSQLWPLWPACSQNRAGYYMPDPTSRIRFSSVFSKEGMDHIVQNRPGSDLDGLVRVWPNTSGAEAGSCAGITWPGFWQNATGPLAVSHFQTRFRSSTDVPDNIVQNRPGYDVHRNLKAYKARGKGEGKGYGAGREIIYLLFVTLSPPESVTCALRWPTMRAILTFH